MLQVQFRISVRVCVCVHMCVYMHVYTIIQIFHTSPSYYKYLTSTMLQADAADQTFDFMIVSNSEFFMIISIATKTLYKSSISMIIIILYASGN